MWRGGDDFMSVLGENKTHYPIVLKDERSRNYKKLSYIATFISIVILFAFILANVVAGHENIPQIFSYTPIITIIALANLGNCDEVSSLEINKIGISILYSNHPKRNIELKWSDVSDIKLVDSDGFEIVFIDSRPRFQGFLTGRKRLTVFFGYEPYELHRLLTMHWKSNAPYGGQRGE